MDTIKDHQKAVGNRQLLGPDVSMADAVAATHFRESAPRPAGNREQRRAAEKAARRASKRQRVGLK